MKRMAMVLLLATASACGDSTGPSGSVAGTYTLRRMDGSTMPALYFQNIAGRIDILSGSLVLRADKSYTQTRVIRLTYYPSGDTETSTSTYDSGIYEVVGTQITFSGAGDSYIGAVAGRAVSYTYDAHSWRFER
jgi:hypothetical protein